MATAHDSVIRDLYLGAAHGPLRVALGSGSFPPHLLSGDIVVVSRDGLREAKPGDFLGLRGDGSEIRLMRFLDEEAGQTRVFAPSAIETVATDRIVGRAIEVVRRGERRAIDARLSGPRLAFAKLAARARQGERQLRLRGALASLYWDLVTAHEDGVSETGDILTTNRCPVGCSFCIYSCVPTGLDMSPEMVGKVARSFRSAGLPRIRILGGEPFMHVPHLVDCYRAVRASYEAESILILTSGYFGTSDERVRGKIDPLVAEGLRHLHLSFDAFHLERYPVSCYERVLDYCYERQLEAALVVHYSTGLAKDLDTLLALRARYPFAVRITTVSREGDAALLSESETSLLGFENFRSQVLAAPGVEVIAEDRSCFRWTAFPSGDVHFCCKENDQSKVGNLGESDFPDLQARLRERVHRNRLNVLRFATSPKGESGGNACLSCPLDARDGASVRG